VARDFAAAGDDAPRADQGHRSNTKRRVVGAFEPRTGRLVARQWSNAGRANLIRFYRELMAAYPEAEAIYVAQDNWPVHFHPDVAASWVGTPLRPLRLPTYAPWTNPIEKVWRKRSKGYAKACDKAGGKLLDHLKTTDTINDMESIRKALGKSQINFYGFSYGSYLGQVYSTLYPTRVRRMVLDGIVDPRGVWYKANLEQDAAFNKSIKIFFEWVAKNDATYKLGTTEAVVEEKYYAALSKLGKKPAGGKLGAAEWNDVFTSAGYYVFGWEDVAKAFAAYVNKGNYKPALAAYRDANPTGKGADNGYAMYLATQCTDVSWPSYHKWRVDNRKMHAEAPFLTWSNVWFNAPCLNWGAKSGTPVTVNGAKAPSMLLINETFDAATPYEGALEVRSRFPKSVLIEGVNGSTHAGSLNGVACTDNLIAAYLTDGSLPARVDGRTSDVKCDPVPQPDPTAPAPAKAQKADPMSRQALQELIGTM
jgi:pimeloyl-ACP methyl ester carboxylesterase